MLAWRKTLYVVSLLLCSSIMLSLLYYCIGTEEGKSDSMLPCRKTGGCFLHRNEVLVPEVVDLH